MDTGQRIRNAVHQCGLESSFVHFCKTTTKQNRKPQNALAISCILLIHSVCSKKDAVLLLGSLNQLPSLLLVSLLFGLWCSLPSWTVPHGHLASPGFCNGWTWYCVFRWLFNNLPCSGFQTPFKSTRAVVSATRSPFAPMTNFTTFYTLHGLI